MGRSLLAQGEGLIQKLNRDLMPLQLGYTVSMRFRDTFSSDSNAFVFVSN